MAGLTLATIRTAAKRRADMENSSFVADAEWTDYINDAGSELHDLLIRADPDIKRQQTSIAVVAGTESYSLAALSPGFYKLRAAFWMSGTTRVPLRRMLVSELDPDYVLEEYSVTYGRPYMYAVLGSELWLSPKPQTSGTVQLWYIPQYTRLSSDSDTVDYPVVNGWEQYLATTAAIKALIKEESDPSALLSEKAALEARIMGMSVNRDVFSSRSMRDVYGWTKLGRRYRR